MALISCTECGKPLSDKAETCPHCGCPTSLILEALAFQNIEVVSSSVSENCDNHNVNHNDDQVHCPKCGSTQIAGKKRGFGLGKAVIGGLLLGPFGLLGGAIGSNQTMVVCLKCGNEWKL